MNVLFPRFPLALLPRMIGYAALGALIAGFYGILHDQFTYTISEEYFTRLKFRQFHYADFGWPRRVYVSEIGFLATWWMGLFAGWFMGRTALPAIERGKVFRKCMVGFAIMFAIALLGTSFGYVLGLMHGPDYSNWQPIGSELGVTDLPSFVRVAYIHNSSYVGGLVGLVIAILYLRTQRTH